MKQDFNLKPLSLPQIQVKLLIGIEVSFFFIKFDIQSYFENVTQKQYLQDQVYCLLKI